MIYEKAANYTWWNYHARRRTGEAGEIRLPDDPQAAVITLDWRGGLPPPYPRKNNDPHLTIRADGRTTINDPFERKPRVEARLSIAEVQELLRFILRDNEFFSLESDKIKAAVDAQLKKGHVTDLQTTYVRIRTAEREHEVRCYALFFYAERYPNIKPLVQLHAIEQRLAGTMAKLRVTGDTDPAGAPQRPKVTKVAVPDLVGMTYTQARQALQANGLKIKATPSKPDDVVLRQNPGAGNMVESASVVIVYMGSPLVEVPDVVGMPYSAARATLLDAGFMVKPLGNTKYRVKSQRPVAGSNVAPGTTITLVLGSVIIKASNELPLDPFLRSAKSHGTINSENIRAKDWRWFESGDPAAGSQSFCEPHYF